MHLISFILSQTSFSENSIKNTVDLLNNDCTIPFIARYRKEVTGNLNEVEIDEISKCKSNFEQLQKRKEAILKALSDQNVLSDDLENNIQICTSLSTLEDLYLPFKKKRNTKAEIAKKYGLEPLAKIIMSQNATDISSIASKYVNNHILNSDSALEGARFIIAEWLNERIDIRNLLRHQLQRYGIIVCIKSKNVIDDQKAIKYRDYFDWSENLKKCPSHRLLAILRAEKEGYIQYKITIDDDYVLAKIQSKVIKNNNSCSDQILLAIKDAYKRLLFPSISNETLNMFKDTADDKAIQVFSTNLKQLLLSSPLGEKRILAIDPGFRTGCKVVCLNEFGELQHNETIYPHAPQNDTAKAIKKISFLVEAYKIDAIAIGNGTASRETEQFIRQIRFRNNVEVFVVSEAGASIYSVSQVARDEFPNYDVTVRGAVSIGRRLADPLAELVKIDPKSIGVGQYQHDVDQGKLKNALTQVVTSCVNSVGVNVNTASYSLLSYVSGIGPKVAENIINYRSIHGPFNTRNDLKKVDRLGDKVFEQAAGFLRIKSGLNPLDNSAVHPEAYTVVETIANDLQIDIAALIKNKQALATILPEKYCNDKVGLLTLRDILNELEKPGLDPREKAKVFKFNQQVNTIHDLHIGQLLPGIISNITNFGCFVDIGIKENGLVHISNLSNTFVSDVNSVVQLHQQVVVKVLEVDLERKRIQLAMNFK